MNDNKTDKTVTGDKAVTVATKSAASGSRAPDGDETEGTSRVVVIDIGKKQKKKAIKRLRQGRGSLMPKIQAAVKNVQEEAGVTGALPIVFVVERKKRSRGFLW